MTIQTVSKNLLFFSLFFSTSIIFSEPKVIFVLAEAENKPILEAEINFEKESHNSIKVDENSSKTAFEQFLDKVYADPHFGTVYINTPYRSMGFIYQNGLPPLSSFSHHYPHNIDVPSKYSFELYKKLKTSDLLVVQAFIQMQEASKMNAIIPTREHGFWKCHLSGNCWKMSKEELFENFEKSNNPKIQESIDSKRK